MGIQEVAVVLRSPVATVSKAAFEVPLWVNERLVKVEEDQRPTVACPGGLTISLEDLDRKAELELERGERMGRGECSMRTSGSPPNRQTERQRGHRGDSCWFSSRCRQRSAEQSRQTRWKQESQAVFSSVSSASMQMTQISTLCCSGMGWEGVRLDAMAVGLVAALEREGRC